MEQKMTKQTKKIFRSLGWILGSIAVAIALYGILKTGGIF